MPAQADSTYPPDLSTAALQVFERLLQRERPGVSLDPDNTWLVFYTLKSTEIPPFTQFPGEEPEHPATPGVRYFLNSLTLRDSLFGYFLGRLELGPGTHFDLFRSAESVADADLAIDLEHLQLRALYHTFKSALEQDYQQRLADYWNVTENGVSRRNLFIAERKKALRLEARLAVERNQLTVTQHNMLDSALDHGVDADKPTAQKHGVFHLALQQEQELPLELCGAFVLAHTASHAVPELNDRSLGEVLLHTASGGPEGFNSLAAMANALAFRFADPAHKTRLLHNISNEQRDRLLTISTRPHQWRLSVENGNVMEAQFDRQVKRQQADFVHLLAKARLAGMPEATFVTRLLAVLQQDAQFDNAFVLDRNDQREMHSVTPDWWPTTPPEHQQGWVRAAHEYGNAISQLHRLSDLTPATPATIKAHNRDWLDQSNRLILAQLRMGLARAQAEHLPANAQAWITAVLDSPAAGQRAKVAGQDIAVDFFALDKRQLPGVLRIGPTPASPADPLLICTLNAPDGHVFRWFPSVAKMREQLVDNPTFARYLLCQLPDEACPVSWHDLQYSLWLKHYHAPSAFSYLPQPKPLPAFTWGTLTFVEQRQSFLHASHDLKIALADAPRTSPKASIGSFLETVVLNVAPFFLPAPILIPLALGAGLLKAWEGFRHVAEHDYKGAAHEFISAVGYVAVAAVSAVVLKRIPFATLDSLRSGPPLIRRIGANGLEHIGYLMSPSSALRLAELDAVLPYNEKNFQSIEVSGQQYFVKTYSNLFGHRELYRRVSYDSAILLSEGDFAVQGSNGGWRKLLYTAASTRSWVFREAERELTELTTNWPTSAAQISASEQHAFAQDYLAMAQTSNAEELPEVSEYCEGGSARVNNALRSGQHNAATRRFLDEFYRLHEYRTMAFRATHVSVPGLERLLSSIGQVFVESGVQSASVSRWGAQEWSRDTFVAQYAAINDRPVFVIFDTTIPKKNLFTGFLGDHVAIAPTTPLQLMATRTLGETLYLYFSRPRHVPAKLYELYSGKEELAV